MLVLGNIWDTRGTPDNGEVHQWSQGESVGEKECYGSLIEMLSETTYIHLI